MDDLREQAYFQMGDENEKIFTPILKEKFGGDIRKTFFMKSVLDFETRRSQDRQHRGHR
jgi:hypothetical protein